jgi:hypothetical protein
MKLPIHRNGRHGLTKPFLATSAVALLILAAILGYTVYDLSSAPKNVSTLTRFVTTTIVGNSQTVETSSNTSGPFTENEQGGSLGNASSPFWANVSACAAALGPGWFFNGTWPSKVTGSVSSQNGSKSNLDAPFLGSEGNLGVYEDNGTLPQTVTFNGYVTSFENVTFANETLVFDNASTITQTFHPPIGSAGSLFSIAQGSRDYLYIYVLPCGGVPT